MRIVIDTAENALVAADGRRLDLYGKEAFELISDLWLKTSWNQKYSYTFTWLGRPIIQHRGSWRVIDLLCFPVQGDG